MLHRKQPLVLHGKQQTLVNKAHRLTQEFQALVLLQSSLLLLSRMISLPCTLILNSMQALILVLTFKPSDSI